MRCPFEATMGASWKGTTKGGNARDRERRRERRVKEGNKQQ